MWLKNCLYFVFVCLTVSIATSHCSEEAANEDCKENCPKPDERPFKLTVIILTMNRPHSLARKVTQYYFYNCRIRNKFLKIANDAVNTFFLNENKNFELKNFFRLFL